MSETAEHAVIRELEEELRIHADIIRPLWMNQSFFNEDIDKLNYHEICVYFLIDVSRTDLLERGSRFSIREGQHIHEFEWLPFERLADEYFYDDGTDQYDLSVEPWEPNITTLVNFDSKWKDLVEKSGIVTKAEQALPAYRTLVESDYKVGIYEGGGYLSEGIYRPYPTCRMRDNTYPLFCPVCQRAISRMIDYQTISISK